MSTAHSSQLQDHTAAAGNDSSPVTRLLPATVAQKLIHNWTNVIYYKTRVSTHKLVLQIKADTYIGISL